MARAAWRRHRTVDELLVARKAHGGEWTPDVVIVSCTGDDGLVDVVRNTFLSSRVLELVGNLTSGDLAMATRTRADGYLTLPDITETTLDVTLQALMRGELPMSPPVANYLLERARSPEASPTRIQPYFSPREHEVIALLLEGLSNKQIAQRLGISLNSAKRHVSAVLHKVNSPSRAHFVAWMLRDD